MLPLPRKIDCHTPHKKSSLSYPMARVLVGLSGGLDSTFTAYLLKEAGYHVEGVHFSHGLLTDETIAIVKQVADFLGISVDFITIKAQFDHMLRDVEDAMCLGQTPNICVKCIQQIKFGYVLEYALSHAFDYVATGHYVRLDRVGDEVIVRKGLDTTKDQSYGFSMIPQEKLRHILTPMGTYIKKTVRELAVQIGLPFIHKESQDLCFTRDFNKFYQTFTQRPITTGSFITSKGHSSPHKGQQFYTRGQKVGVGKDVFYIDHKLSNGDMTVSQREHLYENKIEIDRVNFIVNVKDLDPTRVYQVKIIYRAVPVDCHLVKFNWSGTQNETKLTIITHESVYAPTKGQIATLYDGERVVMGGVITLQ